MSGVSGRRQRRLLMVVDAGWPDTRVEREAHAAQRAGYRVDVICAGEPGQASHEVIDGLRIRRLPLRRRRGMGLSAQLWEYAAFTLLATAHVLVRESAGHYDVVHVHNVPDFLVAVALPARLRGAKVILDLHDLMPEFFESRFGGARARRWGRLLRLQERLATRLADEVITVTELWRDRLIRRGLPADKVHVVMNLPDDDVFRPLPRPARQPGEALRLLYHGTVSHRYGLDVLLDAVDRARREVPLSLTVHGQGEYLAELRDQARRLQLGPVVTFSDRMLPTQELVPLLQDADVGVVPNRNDLFTNEILPTKLLEYAATGLPAIVSRTDAVERYFDGTMVRYVRPGDVQDLADAIAEMYADPGARRSLAANALTFAKQHSWPVMAERYVTLLNEPKA